MSPALAILRRAAGLALLLALPAALGAQPPTPAPASSEPLDAQPVEIIGAVPALPQPLAVAVFLDETSLGGPARTAALAGLRRFLTSGLKPGDRALVASWDGSLAIQQELTGDAAALGAALDRLGTAAPRSRAWAQERSAVQREIQQAPPVENPLGSKIDVAQAEAALGSLRAYIQTRADATRAGFEALQQTLALLAGQPERKALLYVGGGLPLRPGAPLFDAWYAKFSQLATRFGISPLEISRFDATPLILQTAERAKAAGVAIHALAVLVPGGEGEDSERGLQSLAAGTGGRVSTEVRNPDAFLAELAGPAPATRGPAGALPADNPLLQRTLAALDAKSAANPLRVELAVEEETPEQDGRLRVTAVASLPLAALAVQPQEHYHVAHLTLAVAARDGRGKVSGVPRAEVPVEIPNGHLLAAPGESAGYRFILHLAPGESVVAVAVRDDAGGAESVARAVYKGPGTGFSTSAASPPPASPPAAPPAPSGIRVESAALLMSGQEGGEIPLAALALPVPGEAGKARILVRVRMDGPALLAGQTGGTLRIETALYALESGGGVAAALPQTFEIDLAAQRAAVERSGVDLLANLALKPGTYSLRLLARNAATGRLGVRTFPLAVPDPKGLETPPLPSAPAVDPRPTLRSSSLGPLDPPSFPGDAALPSQAAAPAPPPAPLPETAEGRRLRAVARTSYREVLARLAAGRDAEALAAVAELEDGLLKRADHPLSVGQLVEVETGAARELAAADPESLVPLLRFHQRLFEEATGKRRLQGSTVAREVAFQLIDLYRTRGPELARRFTTTLGVELVRGGSSGVGVQALRRALADDPGDETALSELAAGAERRGDHAEAAARLEELLRAHPENREARLRLAIDLARLGRREEARARLGALIREETGGWRLSLAYQELARLQLADGKPAEPALREGLARLPGDEKLTLLLAAALERTAGPAAARETLASLQPEGSEGGGAARHRYNLPPVEPLATALAALDREAAARLPALAAALEKTP